VPGCAGGKPFSHEHFAHHFKENGYVPASPSHHSRCGPRAQAAQVACGIPRCPVPVQQWRERRALSLVSAFAFSNPSRATEGAMIIESASTREVSISSTPSAGATEMAMTKRFWFANAITTATAIGFQLVGRYAAFATFGTGVTLALYAVGGLAVLLRHLVVWRASCSLGD